MYSISIEFTKPIREWWEESLITLKLIPRDTLRGRFQDGSSQMTKVNTLYHSTPCENLAGICQNGLKTTSHSHEVTGCLFGDCMEKANFDWGLSPTNIMPGWLEPRVGVHNHFE